MNTIASPAAPQAKGRGSTGGRATSGARNPSHDDDQHRRHGEQRKHKLGLFAL